MAGPPLLSKSLAEFAARRRQIKWDHFWSGRVPDQKYFSGCKCGICSPAANKLCARQTARLLPKKGFALFGQFSGGPADGRASRNLLTACRPRRPANCPGNPRCGPGPPGGPAPGRWASWPAGAGRIPRRPAGSCPRRRDRASSRSRDR